MALLLLLLAVIPIVTYRVARRRYPSKLFLLSGVSFGLVIAPLSLGLYATYFIPYVGLAPGMLGLLLNMFHGAPGFHLARILGIVSPDEIMAGGGSLWFTLLNSIIWAVVYGSFGFFIDWLRKYKCKEKMPHEAG